MENKKYLLSWLGGLVREDLGRVMWKADRGVSVTVMSRELIIMIMLIERRGVERIEGAE